LNETIKKAKYLYEKGKGRESMNKYWKDKEEGEILSEEDGIQTFFQ
jgi:hypothetical protein